MISEGININVTLLFGLPRYREVTEAYIDGLAERSSRGLPLRQVASVASFFLSRIDVLADSLLEQKVVKGDVTADHAAALRGEVAIASARVAYQIYKEIFSGDRFRALATQGACCQRVLWASTSTKNPAYSDLKYVEALIGPETVNTIPLETLNAYRDHGNPASRLEDGVDEARRVLDRLPEVGIDLAAVTQQLEDEGVEKFVKPFDMLLERLREKLIAVESKP
jgi:transaldolase